MLVLVWQPELPQTLNAETASPRTHVTGAKPSANHCIIFTVRVMNLARCCRAGSSSAFQAGKGTRERLTLHWGSKPSAQPERHCWFSAELSHAASAGWLLRGVLRTGDLQSRSAAPGTEHVD